MTSRNSGEFSTASLALIGTLWFSPVFAQDENPTTPGAIPNPSTYQGSMELQHQSDQQDQQYRQQQQTYSGQAQGQPQQGGYRSSQSSGGQPNPWVECLSHVAGMRALAPIAGKITLGGADPAAVELFDDQSKPTASEKVLLAKWDEARRYCHTLMLEDPDPRKTQDYLLAEKRWGFPATHDLLIQLLNDQITFGQFNYRRAMNARTWKVKNHLW